MITIYGASDDLVEIDGCEGDGEYSSDDFEAGLFAPDRLLAALDATAALAWRTRIRFQWPCWLLAWAWDRQAAADLAFARQCGLAPRGPHCPQCGSPLYDGSNCPDCGHTP